MITRIKKKFPGGCKGVPVASDYIRHEKELYLDTLIETPEGTNPLSPNTRETPIWFMTAELREIEEVDPAMMPELISLFLNDSALRFEKLCSACERRDFKTIRAAAHSMKGSALQMGAAGVASLCAGIESASEPAPDQCGHATRELTREFALVRSAMEEYLAGNPPPGFTARDNLK